MKILVITPNYHPDLGPSAPLFTMLCESLVQRGHDVSVITAVPHYPTGQVPKAFRGKWLRRSVENEVKITRVRLPSIWRSSLAQRMIQFLVFQLGATLAEIGQKCDAVLVANPALQVWLPFAWAVAVKRKPVIFSVHDIYPDVGIQLGIFKTRWQVAFVRRLESYCLRRATYVRILSESFKPGLRDLGVSDDKLPLIYDWVDTNLIQPMPHDNPFSLKFELTKKFVVLYAGNIGLSQGLEHLVSAAERLAVQDDIHFVFVGEGTAKKALEEEAIRKQLKNVQFIPFQPREKLPEVLASAHISVVILKHGIGTASLPSKIFSIMSSGRPILISVDEGSEAWGLIHQAGAGEWVPPEDPARLAEAILKLRREPALCDQLGRNGRAWVEQHHSPYRAAGQFERLLISATEKHKQQLN